jgi:hypothetical protein
MFYLGGDIVHTDAANGPNGPTFLGKSGDIAINQIYVGFMLPQSEHGAPIILMHGGNLSGACYETTPDGRMGWYGGHSESGFYPEQAALVDPTGLQGLISMEPATCNASTLAAGQIAKLANIPTLVVFGDHLADVPTTSGQLACGSR